MELVCPDCGASYKVTELQSIVRDKDSIECIFCNKTLLKWNGSSFWIIKEVTQKPNNPEYNK